MSESALVKRPHCWKSHVTAHLICSSLKIADVLDIECQKGIVLNLINNVFTSEWAYVCYTAQINDTHYLESFRDQALML